MTYLLFLEHGLRGFMFSVTMSPGEFRALVVHQPIHFELPGAAEQYSQNAVAPAPEDENTEDGGVDNRMATDTTSSGNAPDPKSVTDPAGAGRSTE